MGLIAAIFDIDAYTLMLWDVKNLYIFSSAALVEQQFLASMHDPGKVEKAVVDIRDELEKNAELEAPSFKGIKTDLHTVELLKMRITRNPYHYDNCIKAPKSVGIGRQSMSIDEHMLMLWDKLYGYETSKGTSRLFRMTDGSFYIQMGGETIQKIKEKTGGSKETKQKLHSVPKTLARRGLEDGTRCPRPRSRRGHRSRPERYPHRP